MARTKQEIRNFLNSQVGKKVNPKAGVYNGQCVTLTKALLEFLGVSDPYAARGDAKDAGDTYIRQGIGTRGRGWLSVCVNRDMGLINGVRYGHIWIDLKDEANYEQNGAQALHTTKNTRPVSQSQQFINLDKHIKKESNVDNKKPATHFRANQIAHAVLMRGMSLEEFNKHHKGQTELQLFETFRKSKEHADKKKKLTNPPATKVDKKSVVDYINKNLK